MMSEVDFFPRVARGHGSRFSDPRRGKDGTYREHPHKICTADECRQRVGRSHKLSAVDNYDAAMAAKEFGQALSDEREDERQMALCPLCHGSGYVRNVYHVPHKCACIKREEKR